MTLIGYWPLNEESGDTAYDYSGNQNHGGSEESAELGGTTGVLGEKACLFPNRSDRVSISDTSELNPSEITLAAWARFDHLDDGDGDQSSIFRKYEAYVLYAEESSQGMQFYNWEDGTRLNSGEIPVIGKWEFWVATNNGNTMKIYRNGDLVASTDSTDQASSNNALGIGESGDSSESSYGMEGAVQEARIYNRALSSAEIRYLYNVSKRGRFTSRKKQS